MNWKYIIIVIILVAVVGGGFFSYLYLRASKEETEVPAVKIPLEEKQPEKFGLSEKQLPPPITKDVSETGDRNAENSQPNDAVEDSGVSEVQAIDEPRKGTSSGSEDATEELPEISPAPLPQKLLLWQKEAGVRVPGAVSSSAIFKGNQYWLYYTGMGGIRLARSADGLDFQEYGVVVSDGNFGSEQEMVSNPAVFQLKNGKYRMIYEGSQDRQAIRKLYSAVSEDGLSWTKEEGVRLADSAFEIKNGTMQEITFTSVPDVIRLNNDCLRMYYTAINVSRMAESCNEGLTWQKKGKIMFDVYPEVVQDPDIIQLADGKYKLFFSTQDPARTRQWILSALSEDGFNFIVDSGRRIEPASGKARAVDPDIVRLPDGSYRMYYGESYTFEGDFDILSAVSKD